MSKEQNKPDQGKERSAGREDEPEPCGTNFSEMAGCCGPEAADMMRHCPCASWVKRHRVAFYATFIVIGLALLTVPAGAVLGIIAFFRTF